MVLVNLNVVAYGFWQLWATDQGFERETERLPVRSPTSRVGEAVVGLPYGIKYLSEGENT